MTNRYSSYRSYGLLIVLAILGGYLFLQDGLGPDTDDSGKDSGAKGTTSTPNSLSDAKEAVSSRTTVAELSIHELDLVDDRDKAIRELQENIETTHDLMVQATEFSDDSLIENVFAGNETPEKVAALSLAVHCLDSMYDKPDSAIAVFGERGSSKQK